MRTVNGDGRKEVAALATEGSHHAVLHSSPVTFCLLALFSILRGTTSAVPLLSAWQSIQHWGAALWHRGYYVGKRTVGICWWSHKLVMMESIHLRCSRGTAQGVALWCAALVWFWKEIGKACSPRFYTFSSLTTGLERFFFTLCCIKFLTTRLKTYSQIFPILPGIKCGVLNLYAAWLFDGLYLDSVSVMSFSSLWSSTLIFCSTFLKSCRNKKNLYNFSLLLEE